MIEMGDVRYYVKDTAKALKILGFNVRHPEGAKVMYCMHGQTKEEIWIPTTDEGVLEDVLAGLLEPLHLSIEFFRSVYMSLRDDNMYPPDQD